MRPIFKTIAKDIIVLSAQAVAFDWQHRRISSRT